MTIFYPNGKPYINQSPPKKKTAKVNFANRGMTLEEDLNMTNQYYLERDIAVIHKKPTPVQIVNVDYPRRSAAKITEAYFRKASTTDYNGLYRGHYIDFEAKETRSKTVLPLKNFHEHQVEHMKKVKSHGGICFVIIKFTTSGEIFLLDAEHLIKYWSEQKSGGEKSIPKAIIKGQGYPIPQGYMPRIDYLTIVDRVYL
ncbi:recombination protein U [Scopulibacillus daqui]|uniref:Holliday junction resolvase RecU n=1 Tax=Scopulibacillus daqui TaxID=1469162 RepID=A0ABS2PYX9_9BACL|nr:Holliday junction resolvase RecU [Scopulibacillus daqui]MBM7645254.1 recombination protein U [Scopulibacillus daqui]